MKSAKFINGLAVFIFITILTTIKCGKCPSKEVLRSCTCNETAIICEGNQAIDLKDMFNDISVTILDKADKQFEAFVLSNTAVTEIVDNTFHDITFKTILLRSAANLRRITANAFSVLNCETIETFEQIGDSQLGRNETLDEFFLALSSLINVRQIYLDKTSLKSVPIRAFKSVNGFQSKLERIDFNRHYRQQIGYIEDNAFYYLNNLVEVAVYENEINKVSVKAFDFYQKSEAILNVTLRENLLTDTSIELGAFTNSKRPLYIDLRDNKLTYLNESIFKPILRADPRTVIDVDFMFLDCGCPMAWLIKNKDILPKQVQHINCKNGKEFWSLTEKDFPSC